MFRAGNLWVPDGDTYFAPIFKGGDVFEFGNLLAGLAHVKEWGCAVDGGAHVGSWTRYLATKFDRVIAFEPQFHNYECLAANVRDRINVRIFRNALGDRAGEFGLAPGNNTGCWHIADGDGVSVVPLDMFNLANVGYLKLDVEGYEWHALMGGLSTLNRCRPVVQIEEKKLSHSYDAPTARELLEGLGYREVARSGRDVIFVYHAED